MAVRAGIVVTGTEVLTGRVVDRNGPWLSDRLRELGVDLETTVIVGDRPADMLAALRFLAAEGCALLITSGGLGPTADDLTAEVVGGFQGREMVMDEPLRGRIAKILEGIAKRWPNIDLDALEEGNRKQATIPLGATILEPVGTAPGLVVTPAGGGPTPAVVVLPGPPRELQSMWPAAVETDALRQAIRGHTEYRQEMLRMFGIPESEIAETLRQAHAAGIDLDALEITTCLRRGEVEVVTRFEPAQQAIYDAFAAVVAERHGDTLFSADGTSVDRQVADLLLRDPARSVAVAESCTGGLLAARLTDLPGSSAYVRGALVVYSNEAKVRARRSGPRPDRGPRRRLDRGCARRWPTARSRASAPTWAWGSPGSPGPTEGRRRSRSAPSASRWPSAVAGASTAVPTFPGSRGDVRDRSTTVAMHLLRRVLLGLGDLNVL